MKTVKFDSIEELKSSEYFEDGNLIIPYNLVVNCDINYSDKILKIEVNGDADFRGYAVGQDFYWRSIYPPKFQQNFFIRRLLPSAGPNDRKNWHDRFGIDTSKGCYENFSNNLLEVAPELLDQNHWTPVEKMMLELLVNNWKSPEPEWVRQLKEENKECLNKSE